MKTILKYSLPLAGLMIFAACGDDSSSSPAQNSGKYILDEAKQKFAIIYDRCYTGENSTRWDENVDTSWFHYKFISDTLIVFKDGNTADGHHGEDYDVNEKIDGGAVYVGGHAGRIFGTWKTTEHCYHEEGKTKCIEDNEDERQDEAFLILEVSKNSLAFSWELNRDFCFADDYKYMVEDFLLYEFFVDEESLSVSNSDCNTIKIRANGKTATATTSLSLSKDNVLTEDIVYTSGNKTCKYISRRVYKLLQQPKSLCNTDDMAEYMEMESTYHHKYQVNNTAEFYPCLAEMLDIDVNTIDNFSNNEDYED